MSAPAAGGGAARHGTRGAALVSIIGPPAVGKTTLAEHLAESLPARLVREDYEGNPFLADSYLGRGEVGLAAQLYYLLSRTAQLSRLTWPGDGIVVSDYGFCQDAIYARVRLSAEELAVYERVAARVAGLVRGPDVLVCLDAAEATLLERIERRGRDFERSMTAAFLATMRQAYRQAAREAPCAVIRVDCDAADLRQAKCAEAVAEQVREALRAGD